MTRAACGCHLNSTGHGHFSGCRDYLESTNTNRGSTMENELTDDAGELELERYAVTIEHDADNHSLCDDAARCRPGWSFHAAGELEPPTRKPATCGARETTSAGVFTCDRAKGHETDDDGEEYAHAAYGMNGRAVWMWDDADAGELEPVREVCRQCGICYPRESDNSCRMSD